MSLTKETFKIHGMHCASCAHTIKNKVSQIPGVKSVDVNFATETAKIEYQNEMTHPQAINQSISH